jgi:hypothetical protein
MRAALVVASFAVLGGCAVGPPASVAAPQYKPVVVDTACSWDAVVLVPKGLIDYMNTDVATASVKGMWADLEGQILAHDREWRKQCAK